MTTTKEHFSKNDTILLRKRHIGEACQLFFRNDPVKIVRAKGQFMYDENGECYLDCINNVAHVGHCNDEVVKACTNQMGVLNTNSRFLHDNLIVCAMKLTKKLPEQLSVCFFVNSGSEANDLALRMARAHTKRKDVICLDRAYHGNTTTLMEISPYKFEEGKFPKNDWVHVAPTPDIYRGKYCGQVDNKELGENYANEVKLLIDNIEKNGRGLSAFIAESAACCGGQIIYPINYLKNTYKYVRNAGGVCIADEIQVGYGRLGKCWWGFQLQDVVPDIVTVGKAMGNGFPVSAVITTKEIAKSFQNLGMDYFNSFGGNPVSCAAAIAVMEEIEQQNLMENATIVGEHILKRLKKFKDNYNIIGDIRGRGFFIGIELVQNRDLKTPATSETLYLLNRLKEEKILLSSDGPYRNVLKIKPPMIFNKSNADHLLDTLERLFSEIATQIMNGEER